jgi:hypothetical protein
MPPPADDLLLSVCFRPPKACITERGQKLTHFQLQSSLRNALSTFGAQSPQYLAIKYMVDEHAAKLALEGLDISTSNEQDSSSACASR